MIAIVDSGPLFAAVDDKDPDHFRSVELLYRPDFDLIIPSMVVAEVCYFIAKRLNASVEAMFLRSLTAAHVEVESPTKNDWPLIANLVERYSDFPWAAPTHLSRYERLGTDLILTLDDRRFGACA